MGNCESIDEDKIHIPRQGPVQQILVNHCVWSQRYMGLFDYEAREVLKRKVKVQGSAVLVKDREKIIVFDEKMDKLTKGISQHMKQSVFRLLRGDNYYQLLPIIYEQKGELVQKPIWLVIKSLPQRNYSIKQKDILKLGKQKLKVRQVVPMDFNPSVIISNKESIKLSKHIYDQLNYKQSVSVCQEQKRDIQFPTQTIKTIALEESIPMIQADNICRICLEPGLMTNPLITPCKCSGTVRYIHLLCLKQWLSKQIKAVINDFSVTIDWRPLSCQMCKSHYKYRIYMDNQKFYTVDIPKPEKPYIVLEIMKKKNKNQGKIFKFITFKNKANINIGRKKDVDVRISEDISVSRIHATLKYSYQSQQFILEDNHSKFGTLVLAKNGLNIRPHHPGISAQIGAEVFQFQALRSASQIKLQNYELGDSYMREQQSEESDNEQQQGSQQQDEVMELPADDSARRYPEMHSPQVRRSRSLQASSISDFH